MMSGKFTPAAERPYDGESLSSNKIIFKLKIVDEDWDTYFARVRLMVC